MYKEHPFFKSPSDNTRIWRYLDFPKFVSLLDRSALFFTFVYNVYDKYEGVFPASNVQKLKAEYTKAYKEPSDEFISQYFKNLLKSGKDESLINCWHMNRYESAAMWQIYSKGQNGIAIQSTFKRLCDSFIDSKTGIYIGKVKYIDYPSSPPISDLNAFVPFLHKRLSYKHENELRAMTLYWPSNPDPNNNRDIVPDKGEYVRVNLDRLIMRIYVSPDSQEWFKDLVGSTLKRYDLNKGVEQSDLTIDPVY